MKHYDKMKHYVNVICEKYPEEPWKRMRVRAGGSSWRKLRSHPTWDEDVEYEFLPDVIIADNVEVPEPIRSEPGASDTYLFLYTPVLPDRIDILQYNPLVEWHVTLLNAGLLHEARENAQLHLDALINISRVYDEYES